MEVLSEEMLALQSAQEEYYQSKEVTRKMRLDFWLKVVFAPVTTTIVVVWLFFIGYIICRVAITPTEFFLSDKVLIALIGGSSANIIGLLTILMLYVFQKRNTP